MKRLAFFSLLRPIQERFLESTRAQAAPLPLLVGAPPAPLAAIKWGAVAAGAFVVWIWVASLGYGNLESSLALQPKWMAGVHALLLALAVGFTLKARATFAERTRLPYRATTYLFPIGVIDARTHTLLVFGWDEFSGLELRAGRATLRFGSHTFEFPLGSAEQARELEQRIKEHREKLGSGELPERELVLLDPLRDSGFKSPFSPVESMRPGGGARVPVTLVLGVIVAAGLGIGAWYLRNTLSERAFFAEARQKDDVAAYRAYLARGGKRTEVEELSLPRAELRAAVSSRSVEAIDRYIADHKNSKISGEVQGALRIALLAELEAAKAKRSIAALREFERRYQKYLASVPELAHAKHAYLQGVLDRFRVESKAGMPLLDLARRLIIYCDSHGPLVSVRFRQRESRTLEKNERMLMESAYFGGQKTLPTQYLSGANVRSAELQAGKELASELGRAFPPELVRFDTGPAVPDGREELPRFDQPTLLVSYRLEISGAFVTRKPRAVFTGVGFIAHAALTIPDGGAPHELKDSAWQAPELRRIEAGEIAVDGVYGDMLSKAFKRFSAKYATPWLGKEP